MATQTLTRDSDTHVTPSPTPNPALRVRQRASGIFRLLPLFEYTPCTHSHSHTTRVVRRLSCRKTEWPGSVAVDCVLTSVSSVRRLYLYTTMYCWIPHSLTVTCNETYNKVSIRYTYSDTHSYTIQYRAGTQYCTDYCTTHAGPQTSDNGTGENNRTSPHVTAHRTSILT
jgi:hypothetical protein